MILPYFNNIFKISEDVDLITPSPYCRIVLDVCDEMNCLITEDMQFCHTNVESSLRVLTFGAEKVVFALNDLNTNLDRFERRDLICGEPERVIQPNNIEIHNIAKDNGEDSYQKQKIIKFTPINGTRIELMRFETNFNSQKLPGTK